MAKTSTVVDTFATQDAAKWTFNNATASGGIAHIPPTASFPSIQSVVTTYDLTGSTFTFQLVQVPTGYTDPTSPYAHAALWSSTAGTGLRLYLRNGLLYCRLDVGYGDGSFSVAYNATTMKWLRFRESAGQVLFENSPDGISWNTIRTVTTPAYANSVQIEFSAFTPAANGTPTDFEVDNVNNPPSAPVSLPKASQLVDTFDSFVNASVWASTGTVSNVAGQVVIAALAGPSFSGITTVSSFDLTSSNFVAQVFPATGTDDETLFIVSSPTPGTDVRFRWSNGVLTAFAFVGSADASGLSVALDPGTPAWLRISEASGTVRWDYGRDGVTFTNLRTMATPTWISAGGVTFTLGSDNKDAVAPITGGGGGSGTPQTNTSVSTNAPVAGKSCNVDFRNLLNPLDAYSIGYRISTYNGTGTAWIMDSSWSTKLQALGPACVVVPLKYNSGSPVSGATGADVTNSGATWITKILAIGCTPVIQLAGTTQNNFSVSDVTNMVNAFKTNVHHWILGNNADQDANTPLATYMANLNAWAAAIKAADPTAKVSAPASAFAAPSEVQTALQNANQYIDYVGFHAYDGHNGLGATGGAAQNVHNYRDAILTYGGSRAQSIGVALEQFNYYYQAGDTAFYTWQNTCYVADVIGQTLTAEAYATSSTYPSLTPQAIVYADSAGALGLMNDGSTQAPAMPGTIRDYLSAYHGLAAWLGLNGTFRHYGTNLIGVVNNSLPALTKIYATYDTVAGAVHGYSGTKIIAINSDGANASTITIALGGFGTGTYDVWQTVQTTSGVMPVATKVTSAAAYTAGVITITLPAGTVSSIELIS